MALKLVDSRGGATQKISEDAWGTITSEPEVVYRPVPHRESTELGQPRPIWQVRFDLAYDPSRCFGLEINGEVILGRDTEAPGVVTLNAYDARALGVSREHALLRPTETNLYLLDLGSTNGTWRNGHSIGVNMPYPVANGDLIRLGQLEYVVRIAKRPLGHTTRLPPKANLAEALIPIARAIISKLDFNEVLKQTLEITMAVASADEVSVWLVDEQTGELFLEASRGIQNEQIKHLRLPVADTLPGKAIEAGTPLYANSAASGEKVKVKTGYMVEAVIYVPLILGGVAVGVLSAAHRQPGNMFSPDDEKLLSAIADLTAVAVQNARLHQAATKALSHHTKMVTAFNYALSCDLRNMANSTIGYADLLSSDQALSAENVEMAQKIAATGNRMVQLISQLLEVSTLNEVGPLPNTPCDLVDVVQSALRNIDGAAREKSVKLNFTQAGEAYLIRGDKTRLYHSVRALLINALKYSPAGDVIQAELVFRHSDLTLSVQDAGAMIAEDDLSHVFDKYARRGQTSEGQTGIELGLTLVRATVEAHRGTVVAQNLDKQGVVFIITLPATLRLTPAMNEEPSGRD